MKSPTVSANERGLAPSHLTPRSATRSLGTPHLAALGQSPSLRLLSPRPQKRHVSIVIPSYNEEHHIAACLDAIAKQTVKPLEVLVVDNNSTDATAAIARRYPFVTIVREPRQGLVHARNTGFNTARGNIIGRIDVDTILAPNWVEYVQAIFEDETIDAVSGSIGFTDVPFEPLIARIDGFFRHYLARNLARKNELFLYGGNMAMRRDLWQAVRHSLCQEGAYHEDMDLAAHLAHTNYRVYFDDSLRAAVSVRRIDTNFKEYYYYVVANSRTYAAHGLKGRFYMFPVEIFVIIMYLPGRLLYRSYDSQTGRLSLRRIFRSSAVTRVSPVSESV